MLHREYDMQNEIAISNSVDIASFATLQSVNLGRIESGSKFQLN
jgi:hypothetical protein